MFDDDMDDADAGHGLPRLFAALANSDRIAIINTLRDHARQHPEGLAISRVAQEAGLTRFSASRHLRVLCEAGLVTVTKRRRALLHKIDARGFEAGEDWLYDVSATVPWHRDAGAALDLPA